MKYKVLNAHYYQLRAHSGFTLVEFLLYIGLMALIVGSITTLASVVLKSRVKANVTREVEQQGNFAMNKMILVTQNAQSINTPATGSAATTLSISTYNSSENPTIFDVQSGTIRVQRGAGLAIALTNNRVTVSGLNIQNTTATNSSTLKIQFTLSSRTTSQSREYNYSKTFYGGSTIRK